MYVDTTSCTRLNPPPDDMPIAGYTALLFYFSAGEGLELTPRYRTHNLSLIRTNNFSLPCFVSLG